MRRTSSAIPPCASPAEWTSTLASRSSDGNGPALGVGSQYLGMMYSSSVATQSPRTPVPWPRTPFQSMLGWNVRSAHDGSFAVCRVAHDRSVQKDVGAASGSAAAAGLGGWRAGAFSTTMSRKRGCGGASPRAATSGGGGGGRLVKPARSAVGAAPLGVTSAAVRSRLGDSPVFR